MQPNIKQKISQAGFTLVEMSFVLLIASALALTLMQMARVYTAKSIQEKQARTLTNAHNALKNAFVLGNAKYPCPADPTLSPNDANYGFESRDISSGTDGGSCIATWSNATVSTSRGDVLIGSLPRHVFQLNTESGVYEWQSISALISAEEIYDTNIQDPWHNDLSYAVTQALTQAATYNDNNGAVTIIDEFGRNTAGTENNAHYALVSHGRNFVRNSNAATTHQICTGSSGLSTSETENCDGDATYVIAIRNEGDGNFYDDMVTFGLVTAQPIWADGDTSLNPVVSGLANSGTVSNNIGNIGINTTTPTEALDINGNLLSESYLRTSRFCEDNGTNSPEFCWEYASLYDLECNTETHYMAGTQLTTSGELEPICESINFVFRDRTCSDGRTLAGIYTNGDILCN